MRLALEIVGAGTLLVLIFVAFLLLRAWPIEASLKAKTANGTISLAAGISLAGLSGSAAAIFDGPGVVAVHLRTRELWRRTIPNVSFNALLQWLKTKEPRKKAEEEAPGFRSRMATRIKNWLLPRTDLVSLPDLGLRVVGGLEDVSFHGGLTIGFSDPGYTGKAAALLYPIAGILSPLGTIHLAFDWSGRNVLDGDAELSLRVIPARILRDALRFARHHITLRLPTNTKPADNKEEADGVLEQQQ